MALFSSNRLAVQPALDASIWWHVLVRVDMSFARPHAHADEGMPPDRVAATDAVVLPTIGSDNAGMPPAPPPDDDDDFELELEAVDPEIIAMQQRRAREKTEEAVASINPDELFPDEHGEGLGIDWEGIKKFRFTTRHLLVLTAGLAMVMTLFIKLDSCMAIFLLGMVTLGGGWYWVMRQERQHELERARRRAEFFASRGAGGEAATTAGTVSAEADDAGGPPRREFSFRFSMQELFGAMTAAAVVMGLIGLMGLDKMAMLLGLVALAGVVLLMLVDVPHVVVLAWWILLLLYLAVGAIAALWGKDDGQTARRRLPAPAFVVGQVIAALPDR